MVWSWITIFRPLKRSARNSDPQELLIAWHLAPSSPTSSGLAGDCWGSEIVRSSGVCVFATSNRLVQAVSRKKIRYVHTCLCISNLRPLEFGVCLLLREVLNEVREGLVFFVRFGENSVTPFIEGGRICISVRGQNTSYDQGQFYVLSLFALQLTQAALQQH